MCGGTDRFVIKNDQQWLCRHCSPRYSDAIELVKRLHNVDFIQACEMLSTPIETVNKPQQRFNKIDLGISPSDLDTEKPILSDKNYLKKALSFVHQASDTLQSKDGDRARLYLINRGIDPVFFDSMLLGFNLTAKNDTWGNTAVWLPRGVIIPHWMTSDVNQLWRINIRRATGDPKYIQPAGCSTQGLYTVGFLRPENTVILCEGEFDAICLKSALRNRKDYRQITAIATGSATGSRILRNVAKLAVFKRLLIAFDADQAGDDAATWWKTAIPTAIRVTPYEHDITDMYTAGSLNRWINDHI